MVCEMTKLARESQTSGTTHVQAVVTHYSTSSMSTITSATVAPTIAGWMDEIASNIENMVNNGSGWTLSLMESFNILVMKSAPLSGGCSLHTVTRQDRSYNFDASFYGPKQELPPIGTVRKAINVEELTEDQRRDPRLSSCFYLAVAQGLWGLDDGYWKQKMLTFMPMTEKYEKRMRQFPNKHLEIEVADIDELEENFNALLKSEDMQVSIAVTYVNEENEVYPLRVGPVYRRYAESISKYMSSANTTIIEPKVVVLMLRYLSPACDPSVYVGHYAYVVDPDHTFGRLYENRSKRRRTSELESSDGNDSGISDNEDDDYLSTIHLPDNSHIDPQVEEELTALADVLVQEEPDLSAAPPMPLPAHYRVHRQRLCFNCFRLYENKHYLSHIAWCHKRSGQRVVMPKMGERMSFKSSLSENLSAFTVYFDFEAGGQAVDDDHQTCKCSPAARARRNYGFSLREREELACLRLDVGDREFNRHHNPSVCPHKTEAVNLQSVYSVCMIIVERNGKVHEEFSYAGSDAVEVFLHKLLAWERHYLDKLTGPNAVPINITKSRIDKWKQEFDSRPPEKRLCHICKETIHPNQNYALDHDHLNGNPIDMAHISCNLRRTEKQRLVCFAHNLSGYDGHFLLKEIEKVIFLVAEFASFRPSPLARAGARGCKGETTRIGPRAWDRRVEGTWRAGR